MKLVAVSGRKKTIWIAFAIGILSAGLWVAYGVAATRWPWVFDWREMRQANRVITAVDSFQVRSGRLPETLPETGIDMSRVPDVFYRKTTDGEYIVWFGTVLGESATYESSTKKWH
jgi:hypothetical protein